MLLERLVGVDPYDTPVATDRLQMADCNTLFLFVPICKTAKYNVPGSETLAKNTALLDPAEESVRLYTIGLTF